MTEPLNSMEDRLQLNEAGSKSPYRRSNSPLMTTPA